MKGVLCKTETGWQVCHATYDVVSKRWTGGKLPLHPDTEPDYDYDRDMEGEEVEFEIVDEIPESCHNNPFCAGDESCIRCYVKYAKLIEPKTGSKIDLQKLEAKLDKILAEETPESFHKWLESKTGPIRNYHSPKVDEMLKEIEQDDVYEMAQEYAIKSGSVNRESRRKGFVDGYNKAKATLYTEEQVREAIYMARLRAEHIFWYNDDEIIQSLKQPKKD